MKLPRIRISLEMFNKWMANLRSGLYDQGTHCLRRKDAYCCLGVLCDTMGLEWQNVHGTWYAAGSQESCVLPPVLRPDGLEDPNLNDTLYTWRDSWSILVIKTAILDTNKTLEIPVEYPKDWRHGKTYDSVACMNDSGVPFKDIADFLELNRDVFFELESAEVIRPEFGRAAEAEEIREAA